MLSTSLWSRLAAASCACVLAASAHAQAPVLGLSVSAGSISENASLIANSTTSSGTGFYFGSLSGSTSGLVPVWNVNYNVLAASSSTTGSMSGSLTVQNLTSGELTFIMSLSLPTAAALNMTGLYNGSISGSLTTTGAGYLVSSDTNPLWGSSSQATAITSMFAAPVNISRTSSGTTSLGSQTFGGSQPSFAAPLFGTDVTVSLRFRLSANSSATFSTAIGGVGTVPAPGAIALFGAFGLVPRRRRR